MINLKGTATSAHRPPIIARTRGAASLAVETLSSRVVSLLLLLVELSTLSRSAVGVEHPVESVAGFANGRRVLESAVAVGAVEACIAVAIPTVAAWVFSATTTIITCVHCAIARRDAMHDRRQVLQRCRF